MVESKLYFLLTCGKALKFLLQFEELHVQPKICISAILRFRALVQWLEHHPTFIKNKICIRTPSILRVKKPLQDPTWELIRNNVNITRIKDFVFMMPSSNISSSLAQYLAYFDNTGMDLRSVHSYVVSSSRPTFIHNIQHFLKTRFFRFNLCRDLLNSI
jgi:hypothetical protein